MGRGEGERGGGGKGEWPARRGVAKMGRAKCGVK